MFCFAHVEHVVAVRLTVPWFCFMCLAVSILALISGQHKVLCLTGFPATLQSKEEKSTRIIFFFDKYRS